MTDAELIKKHIEWLKDGSDIFSNSYKIAEAMERALNPVKALTKDMTLEDDKRYLYWDELNNEWIILKGRVLNMGPSMFGKDFWAELPGAPMTDLKEDLKQ